MIRGPLPSPGNLSDDATFRSWAQGIHDALLALGLVQTADTGQINLATALKPTVSTTAAGYEIWRFNDALQAVAPIFLKIEYGSGSSVTVPEVWITVGAGSNGAGVLTGASSRYLGSPNLGVAGSPGNLYGWSDGSGIALLFSHYLAGAIGVMLVVDRMRDEAGAPVADGAYVYITNPSQPAATFAVGVAGVWGSSLSSLPVQNPGHNAVGRSASGPDAAVAQPVIYAGRPRFTKVLVCSSADFAAMATAAFEHLGSPHTFLCVNHAGAAIALNGTSATAPALLMPWD